MVSLVLLIFKDSVPICQDHLRMPQCQWNIMMNMGKLTTRITNRHHNQTKHNQAVCLFCCIHFMFMLFGCRHPSSYLQCSLLFTADTPSRPTHPWWKLADIARILPMEKNNVLQYQYIMTSRVQLVTQKYQYKLYQYWKKIYFESKIVFILHHRSFAAINYYTDNSYSHSFWRKSHQKANRGQRQAPRTDRVQRAARSSDAHSPSARPSSHRPQHTAAAPTTGPHPSNRQPQRPDSQRRRVAPSVSQDTRTYRTPYPPHLMDIPTQPPHTPTRSHAPRGQPTSNLPYVSNPRVKNPSDVPAVPPNTQCQLCLGWGHSAVICRSRDSKCYACSKHGHLARACPLLSP